MTRLCLTLSLLISSVSFAETCFKAVTEIPVESKIPETICISSAQLNLVDPGFPKAPYYEAVVVSSLGTLSELANPKEHKAPYRLSVTKNLVREIDWACGEFYASQINVTFNADAQGKTISPSLQVYGEILSSPDRCHSSTTNERIEFSRI
jgi:hypothetical protein